MAKIKEPVVKSKPAAKKKAIDLSEHPLLGKKAPAFKLKNEKNETVSLADFKGQTIILFFYPKDMTSGCTVEACDFRDSYKALQKKGAVVFGISRDSVESHVKFIGKEKLSYSLLADAEGKACEAYGVWKEKSMYGRKYMGIERSTFIISGDQKIAKVFQKVKVPGHVAEVLASF